MHIRHTRQGQGIEHQADDFDIAGRTGVAVQLGTQLDRAARSGERPRLGVQHAAGIAQAARALATQGVRIHPRHLRGDVGPEAHLPPGQRIGHLEGAQIQVLTGTGEQGLEVFDVRGDDELVAPTLEQIQHLAACRLDQCRFRRQYFFDAIWQEPAVYRCHFAIPLSVRAAAFSEADTGGQSPAACWPAP